MGSGWRRAFCTTIPRNSTDSPVLGGGGDNKGGKTTPRLQSSWSLRSRTNNDINSTTTPRLRLRPGDDDNGEFRSSVIDNLNITPRLRCKTTKSNLIKSSSSSLLSSNPSSPRSPFSIFKSSFGFSRSNCGLCFQSVKTGHKTAIFTAECSHTFHFPCISQHVKQENLLVCPVCKTTWRDASFLAIQSNNHQTLTTTTRSEPTPKPYNDDEPLGTPRAAPGGILPIPEDVDDIHEQEEEQEEFQGFFVNNNNNPISSSSSDEFRRDFNKNVDVMIVPEVAVITSSRSHETYALVLKVKAPPPHLLLKQRAPIDLVAVLDVSPTMGGPKLQMLKRAMRLVISSLAPADRLSIVAFSSAASPKRLLPLRRMHPRGQRSARRIIDHLSAVAAACTTGTCAGEALRKATKVLEDRRERNPVCSIILLSDDHVTEGQQQPSTTHNTNNNNNNNNVMSSSTRFAHVEIPVHTLEKNNSHGHSHGHRHDDENAFTKCVGGLLSVVAQDLRIELGVGAGSDPAEITAVYSCNGKPTVLNTSLVRLGDVYAEEEREVLIELRVPCSIRSHHNVLSARCSYNHPATQQLIYAGEKALLVPTPQTTTTSPKIQRLRNLFIATRAVAESRLLLEHNKLTTARHLLSSARALLMHSPSAQEFVKGLESELAHVEYYQNQKQGGSDEPPTSASRAATHALTNKSVNRVSDLHGLENARF